MYSNLFKLGDDVKCYKAIHNLDDSQSPQFDVDWLVQWSLDSKLSFNINKFVVLQCKHSNFDTSYHINNRELSKVTEHHDLDIILTENWSWHSYEAIVAKAYKSLGLLEQIIVM